MLRRTTFEAASSSDSLAGSSSSSAGSTTTSAPASSPISPSSVDVHAAWTGPRRPRTTISRMRDAQIASIARSVVSVGDSSSRVSASMRATSSATFPFPMTTARSWERSNGSSWKSGWPLYQATSSVAAHEPGRSSPGIPSRRSVCEPTAYTTASYSDASSSCDTSRPTSTLPRKRKPGRAAIFSNAFDTVLSCGWSGATPSRTRPHGVGSRSIMSTSTVGSSLARSGPAA